MEEDEMKVIENEEVLNKLSKFRIFPEDILVGLGVLFIFFGIGIMLYPIIIYSPEAIDLLDAIIYIVSSSFMITLSSGMFFMSSVLKYLRKIIKINEEKR